MDSARGTRPVATLGWSSMDIFLPRLDLARKTLCHSFYLIATSMYFHSLSFHLKIVFMASAYTDQVFQPLCISSGSLSNLEAEVDKHGFDS